MNDNISDFLRKRVRLFEHLSENKLDQILKSSKVVSYEPNEAVVRFGEDADFLGVLLKGKLSASVISDNGSRTTIGHFSEGDTFGEMALMSRDKTVADLVAEINCLVLRIPVELFQSTIMTEPNAIQQMSKTVADRFRQLMEDPQTTAAAFRKSADPYGLQLKGERPEKILVINCGSSSLKYSFFDSENESNTVRGQVERIGIEGTRLIHKGKNGEVIRELPGGGFEEALKAMLKELTGKVNGVIKDPSEITVVGHRVVHGGE